MLRLSYVHFCTLLWFRPNGLIQPFSTGEVGSSQSGHDLHGGFARPVTKSSHLMPHSSPSRLGQQPVQRLNHGRSTAGRGSEWNHTKVQPSSSSSGVSHSPGNSLFSNGTSWGKSAYFPCHSKTVLLSFRLYFAVGFGWGKGWINRKRLRI